MHGRSQVRSEEICDQSGRICRIKSVRNQKEKHLHACSEQGSHLSSP